MASSREAKSSETLKRIQRINKLLECLAFASGGSVDHRNCHPSDSITFISATDGYHDIHIFLHQAIIELCELRDSSGELPEMKEKILSTIVDRALNSAKHRRYEPFRLMFDYWCKQVDAKEIPEPFVLKSFVSTLRNGLLSKFGAFFHPTQKQAFIAGLDSLSEDLNAAKQQLVLLLNQNKTLLPKGESFDRWWEITVVYNVDAPRSFFDFDAKKLNRILLLERVKQIYPTILIKLDVNVPSSTVVSVKKLAAAFATVPPTVKTLILNGQSYYYPNVPTAKWLKLLNQLPAPMTSIRVDHHVQSKIDAALLETQRRGYKIAAEVLPFSQDLVGEVMTFVAHMPHFWNKRSVVPPEEKTFKEKHLKKAILR